MRRSGIDEISSQQFGDRLLNKQPGGRLPLVGQWELTCRCNLQCIMCYTDPLNTLEDIGHELRYDEIVRILDELREAGCVEICFTGGEPLARPDFLDIHTYARNSGFLVTIFTNGTLITPRVADHLALHRPKMVEISAHGLTTDSFDRITGRRGSFGRCREGIALLLERGLPVTIKTQGMTVNRDEILEIKRWADSLGAVRFKFGAGMRPRLDGSNDTYAYQLTQQEIAAIEEADPQMCAERREKLEAERDRPLTCGGGKLSFHIDAYGQLQLCSNNRRRGYDLRHGTFREGFYELLPTFPCPQRQPVPVELRPVPGRRPGA